LVIFSTTQFTTSLLRDGGCAQGGEGGEDVFYVKMVRKARKVRTAAPEFRIRWWGYGEADDTWEPLENLDDDPLTYTWENPAEKESARQHAAKWIMPQ
jgi:hypothetical protein